MSLKLGFSHLGPFVLTKTLLPILEATAAEPGSDVRVVTVSLHPLVLMGTARGLLRLTSSRLIAILNGARNSDQDGLEVRRAVGLQADGFHQGHETLR